MTQEEFHKRYQYNPNTDCLGEGGFGKVYKAYDTHLNHYVAIKMAEVKPHLEEVRLRKEVEVISKLPTHPNIAHYDVCYTFSTFAGEYDFGVLQYYEHGNLQQLLSDNQLTYEQKDSMLKSILEGIVFLHSHCIIHRDLKPQNILIALNQKGIYIPKITDFGISKKLDVNKSSVFTNSLAGAGTLSFASPEQLLGNTIRKNTDLWSFGVIACWMFTGNLPFNSGSLTATSEAGRIELFKQITSGEVSAIIAQLPADWQKVVKHCLVVDVEKRISGAGKCLEMVSGHEEVPFENHKSEIRSLTETEISIAPTEAVYNATNYNSTHIETFEPKTTVTIVQVEEKKNHLLRNIFIGAGISVLFVILMGYLMDKSNENTQQSSSDYKTELPTLTTQIDSLNYAFGLGNGAGIKEYYLKGDSIEFKISSVLFGIEKGYNGESSNDKNEFVQLGVQIGTSFRSQEYSGLMGFSTWKTNYPLIFQGVINGMRGVDKGMNPVEANNYIKKNAIKIQKN